MVNQTVEKVEKIQKDLKHFLMVIVNVLPLNKWLQDVLVLRVNTYVVLMKFKSKWHKGQNQEKVDTYQVVRFIHGLLKQDIQHQG